MKKKRLLALCLTGSILASLVLAGCGAKEAAPPEAPDVPPQTVPDVPEPAVSPEDAIRPLEVKRRLETLESVNGITPYGEYQSGSRLVPGDLSGNPALAYSLSFCDMTEFEGDLPQGYDPLALLEWGKDPGLNVDLLHEHGFTGKGAVIAYVDQPIPVHEQYEDLNLHYTNNDELDTSMHGPAVLSLLAGKDIGTAPEAEVYYYAYESPDDTKKNRADCLYQIIEQNESLPEGEKITMVGFSKALDYPESSQPEFVKAISACKEAGIMVWLCDEYKAAAFLPLSNKNDCRSLVVDQWFSVTGGNGLVYVPDAGRTTASRDGSNYYTFWAFNSGLSWTTPYMLGLYAIANEIDPTLTQDQLRELVVDTACRGNGISIINPVGFIAAVLDGAGRGDEADALRRDAAARERYLYAVLDPASVGAEDLTAIGSYLAAITDAEVLTVDARAFSGAADLEAALRSDAAQRGGAVSGVQFFGAVDWDTEPLPWPTERLTLAEGEYTDFFTRYRAGDLEDGVFAPNPAWPLFVSSANIPVN